MDRKNNPMYEQLENERFATAVSYVRSEAHGIKKFGSNELAHLNQMLTNESEPWRIEPVEIQIPSGEVQKISLISNPQSKAREIVGNAHEIAVNEDKVEAIHYVYSRLILEHLFRDANRRTAALAAYWVAETNGVSIDPEDLVQIPVANLRDSSVEKELLSQISKIISDS